MKRVKLSIVVEITDEEWLEDNKDYLEENIVDNVKSVYFGDDWECTEAEVTSIKDID